MTAERDPIAAAAAWHLATTRDDMDWDGFTLWLEADPRHAATYDQIALADAMLGDTPVALEDAMESNEANQCNAPLPRPVRRTWRRWAGVAVAASLIALVVVPRVSAPTEESYSTQAAPRSIALADGSRIFLAPHSEVTVAGHRQTEIALSGGAWFDIRHDPARPLRVTAGPVTISDIGTRFDVQAGRDRARVEVADGRVAVSSEAMPAPVELAQGRRLAYDRVAGTAETSPFEVTDAGAWRYGRLHYSAAPLALVADDLARYAGTRVELGQGLADRRFSGTLALGDGKRALRDLSQLMGLRLGGDATRGYRLESPR